MSRFEGEARAGRQAGLIEYGKATMKTALISIASTILAFWPAAAGAQGLDDKDLRSCATAVNASPGIGVEYKGLVSNSDYVFKARIPGGMSAWGGVALEAPFHGFIMFLDDKKEACIWFEIHIRVDEDVPPVYAPNLRSLQLGTARAWQESRRGQVDGRDLINLLTAFSNSRQEDATADGEVLLIAPPSRLARAKFLYEQFLGALKFYSSLDNYSNEPPRP